MKTSIPDLLRSFDETHYREIGKVAANWAVLEAMVGSALWVLAKIGDNIGACLTAQIPNMARRMDAFEALVRLHGGSERLLKSTRRFVQDTYGLNEQRNRIVHDPWHVDTTGNLKRLEITAKGRFKFGHVPVKLNEITEVVALIHQHINRFESIMRGVNAELGPLPGMPLE